MIKRECYRKKPRAESDIMELGQRSSSSRSFLPLSALPTSAPSSLLLSFVFTFCDIKVMKRLLVIWWDLRNWSSFLLFWDFAGIFCSSIWRRWTSVEFCSSSWPTPTSSSVEIPPNSHSTYIEGGRTRRLPPVFHFLFHRLFPFWRRAHSNIGLNSNFPQRVDQSSS